MAKVRAATAGVPLALCLLATLSSAQTTSPGGNDCSDPSYVNPCQSYGVDFQGGGSYFQNSLSNEDFNATQEFEGCQADDSYNMLVDPNGNQYLCTNTSLTPADTPMTFTCPLEKSAMESGDWSIIILSNNGADGCPIDYMRDFSLSVGPQSTVYVAPEVTVSAVSTPVVVASNTTSTQTLTSTAKPYTTTVPQFNFNPTFTVFPLPTIAVVTKAIVTVTSTDVIPHVVATSTAKVTPSCSLQGRKQTPDAKNDIAVTILSHLGLAKRTAEPIAAPIPTAGLTPSLEFKRAMLEGRAINEEEKHRFLIARRERLALNKRAPDQPTVTSTNLSLATSTTTISSVASATTVVGTTTIFKTTTLTPTVTVSRGVAASIATVTAKQQTMFITDLVPATTVEKTVTSDVTLTVTETTTPAGAAAACASKGGVLV